MQVRKLIKLLVAMTLAAGVLYELGCKGRPEPASAPPPPAAAPAAVPAEGPRVLRMSVTERGFEPAELRVKKGEPLLLIVTRKTDETCATELRIQGTDIDVPLPLGKPVEVRWTPHKSGRTKYGCAMGMMVSGDFDVTE